MKLKTASSLCGKILIFPVLISLFLIYSANVSAQNKNAERNSTANSPSKTPEQALDTTAAKIFDKDFFDALPDSIDRQASSGKNDSDGEAIPASENKIERFNSFYKTEAKNRVGDFRSARKIEGSIESGDLLPVGEAKKRFGQNVIVKNQVDDSDYSPPIDESFRWRSAIGQSLMFLAVQHGYAMTQPKTREALKGKFFKDYAASVKSLHGWDDGGRFFTNYIAHPMQGSITGFIYVQNDPKALKQQFGAAGDYWKSRLKAMAWTAAWSTQFEIGPLSQASIGNVGLKGKQTYIDLVVTPTIGTALLVGEEAVDRFIMKRIERATDNFYAVMFSRMLLSPTRVFANLLRFQEPWKRDRPRER